MQKKNKRWLADINVKHLHKEYLLLMSVRLNERKGYWNVFYCNFSQHHEEGKYWGSKSDYSLLCLKGTEGFLFRFNHSLQYPFQQKDLLWQILCQGKSRGVYVTVLADTSIWKVCALVDFPLSSCYKRTSLFSTPVRVRAQQAYLQGLILQPFNHYGVLYSLSPGFSCS